MDINYSLNRRIHQTLYTLKRGFGNTVKIYKLIDTTTDYKTGITTESSSSITIGRCIVLPARVQREVVQSISIISANKEFAYGGSYDADTRIFIIDSKDLPKGHVIQNDDWVEFDNYRYNPKTIEELVQHTGWLVTAKRVVGPTITEELVISEPELTSEDDYVKL